MNGRPTRAGNPRPSAYPWHARKDTIVLQLLDLLTAFSFADLFSAAPNQLFWQD